MLGIETIHLEMGKCWPGLHQEKRGQWILRFGEGYTSRANSCLPVGDPGMTLDEAIDLVEESYQAAGLTPKFQVPLQMAVAEPGRLDATLDRAAAAIDGASIESGAVAANPQLDDLLAHRGYDWTMPSIVMTLPTVDGTSVGRMPEDIALDWTDEPSDAWLSLCPARFHQFPSALAVTTAHPARYVTLHRDGESVGRGRVSRAGDLFDVSDLELSTAVRGQGLGRTMMQELALEGRRLGAGEGVLQVESDNIRAFTLYRSLGWEVKGGYHYRCRS